MTHNENGIICKLTCHHCGAANVPFLVRYREPTEDVVAWVEKVIRPAMGRAHLLHSPVCMSGQCDLYIPFSEGAKGLGTKIIN